MTQRLSVSLWLRTWSWRPGTESCVGLPAWSLLLPLPVSLPLSLCLSFIYSWETHRKRQTHRQREKQAPRREPDVGLDPRTWWSWPELKADAQPLSHPGVLRQLFKPKDHKYQVLKNIWYADNKAFAMVQGTLNTLVLPIILITQVPLFPLCLRK